MDLSRKLAGYTLIFASLGLAGISGFVSNSGLSAMLPGIPGIGYLGFVIAVALVGLGVAVSSEVASQRFAGAAIFAAFLAGTAFTDRQTNFISFQSQVQAADQVAEDRNAAYRESAQALKLTRAEISKLEAELVLMQSQDAEGIKKAQLLLSGLGLYEGKIDGQRGPKTLNAMRAYGKALRERLGTLRTDETKHSSIVSTRRGEECSTLRHGSGVVICDPDYCFLCSPVFCRGIPDFIRQGRRNRAIGRDCRYHRSRCARPSRMAQ